MIERYEIVNKYDDTPVGADSISALQSEQLNNFSSKTVGAESISALQSKQQDNMPSKQRADMESKQRADMSSKQRADMESAPTGKYHRRSIRLKHYDYARAGYYFVTITTQNREHLFGEICDGEMVLNVAGEMVQRLWYDITHDFPNVALHDFVVMPNHIHGIIEIVDNENNLNTVGADSISALQSKQPNNMPSKTVGAESIPALQSEQSNNMTLKANDISSKSNDTSSKQRADMESAPTLSTIVQSFKRHTTLQYIKMVKNNTLPPFNKRIWQRNYYEHVVRDENDYVRIAEYIQNNVMTWESDSLNKP